MILITGKTGVGKTTLLQTLNSKEIIHMDNWVKENLYTNGHEVIEILAKEFGKEIIQNNSVNTKELGKIVLQDSKELKKLEDIVNPYMRSFLEKHKDNKDLIVEMAIYLKNEEYFKDLFQRVILIRRGNVCDNKFDYLSDKKNLSHEVSDDIKYDYLIENNRDIQVVKNELIKIIEMT